MPHPEQVVVCPQGHPFIVLQEHPLYAHVFESPLERFPNGEPNGRLVGFIPLVRSILVQRFRCVDCVDSNGCRMEYADEASSEVG